MISQVASVGAQPAANTEMSGGVEIVKGLHPLPPPPADAPKPSRDPRDFAGTYTGTPRVGPDGTRLTRQAMVETKPTYTPEAAKIAERRTALRKQYKEEVSPFFLCRPYQNFTSIAQAIFPFRVVQTRNRLVIMVEEGRGVWEIYLDRSHPASPTRTYNGHSVGRWEGDTLVVDTTGFNGKQWLDLLSGPQSTDTHVYTRIRKLPTGKLEFDVRMEDPKTFATPRLVKFEAEWHPEAMLVESNCEEGLDDVDAHTGVVFDDKT
jgi:hypothetical protein